MDIRHGTRTLAIRRTWGKKQITKSEIVKGQCLSRVMKEIELFCIAFAHRLALHGQDLRENTFHLFS